MWYIAVVILGQSFRFAQIQRDESVIDNLTCIEERFWKENVVPGIMPEPDGSKACDAVLEQYFKISRKGSTIPLIGFDEKLKRRGELSELIGRLEQEQKQIDQEIKLYMKDNEAAVSDRYRVTWSRVESTRLDAKRIKEERPEVYQDFLNVTASRRFTVKAA